MANGDEINLQVFEDLRGQIIDCITLIRSQDINCNVLDYVHRRLDQIWREVFRLTEVSVVDEKILACISDAIACLQHVENIEHSVRYQAPIVDDGSSGRPVFNITPDQLHFFWLMALLAQQLRICSGFHCEQYVDGLTSTGYLKTYFGQISLMQSLMILFTMSWGNFQISVTDGWRENSGVGI